jgi:hypothetical protein
MTVERIWSGVARGATRALIVAVVGAASCLLAHAAPPDAARDPAPAGDERTAQVATTEMEVEDREGIITRVATTAVETRDIERGAPKLSHAAPIEGTSAAIDDPIARARRIIDESRARFEAEVRDYTCVFFKRERIDGRMTDQYVMMMKARPNPKSVYFKFLKPDARAGREAIFVAGRNNGRALVHDVGFGKLLAGTLALDPLSRRAMEDCRHPITSAGIGHLLDTIAERWAVELTPGESVVEIRPTARVGDRPCLLIVSTHPERRPGFLFHRVKVYIDQELGLPIRFEAYDWPDAPGQPAPLVEEYTYMQIQLNVGLTDRDFDPANSAYSFGRF